MRLNYRAPLLGLLVALAACGTDSESPMTVEPFFAAVSESAPANVYVCKVDYFTWFGADLPAPDGVLPLLGTGDMVDVDVAGGDFAMLEPGEWGDMAGTEGRKAIRDGSLPDNCALYSTATAQMLMVTENLETDQALKKVTVRSPAGTVGYPQVSYEEAIATAGTPQSVTLDLTGDNAAGNWFVWFKNVGLDVPDEETGMEGCTPGYWGRRQHLDSWTDVATDDLVRDIFAIADELMAYDDANGSDYYGWTLLEAVNQRGNGNRPGQMLRHATAALLNAYSLGVDYPYTSGEIIDMVQQAMADGVYEDTKDMFADANELGCDLN